MESGILNIEKIYLFSDENWIFLFLKFLINIINFGLIFIYILFSKRYK